MKNNPWIIFGCLAAVNASLSYLPLSLEYKLCLFVFGLLPLLILAFYSGSRKTSPVPPELAETLGPIRPWIGWVLAAGGLGLRFFKLDSLSTWPNLDEGRTSFFAIEQARHWDWKLLFGYNQLPPFYYWSFALFFKWFTPSLWSLWLFPALLSAAVLFWGIVAARAFFSKSISFIAAGLLAFSFWPLYSGRFAAEGLGVLLWELVALSWLGFFLKNSSPARKKRDAFVLGVLTGLGFYVHLHWFFIAPMIAAAVFLNTRKKGSGKESQRYFFWFILPAFTLPLPLLAAAWRSDYGSYLHYLLAFSKTSSGGLAGQFLTTGSYLSALFWGCKLDYFAYKPFWGGLLNPLLGSLFFVGLIRLFQGRRRSDYQWILFSFPLFLLPALLTKDVETFRIIQILPLLLITASFGLQGLLLHLKKGRPRALLLAGLFFFSVSLDVYHLTGPYARFWTLQPDQWTQHFKSLKLWKSYRILEPLAQQQGPGAVLFESTLAPQDQTLVAAAYAFNASSNPRLQPDQIHWAGVFLYDDEEDYFLKRFPRSKYYPLDIQAENLLSGLQWIHEAGLQWMTVDAENQKVFTRWMKADRILQEAAFQELNLPSGRPHTGVIQGLTQQYSLFQSDPFLESLYWQKLADCEEEDGNGALALQDTRQALQLGIHRAALYHRLGVLAVRNHQYAEARLAFLRAGQLNPLFRPPPSLLQKLAEKKETKP